MKTIFQLFFGFTILLLFSKSALGQDIIELTNPSFEGFPQQSTLPVGWIDCGFEGESPPDIQPGGFFVIRKAYNGDTYLGMVSRDNFTFESVTQPLLVNIKAFECYRFSVYLCQSKSFKSPNRKDNSLSNFDTPISFEVWLGNEYCERDFLIGTTKAIDHQDWKEYEFEFQTDQEYSFITLQAGSIRKFEDTVNGNILIDNLSPIYLIDCFED
ncbi:MAG: hypothetical protein KDC24_09540 [Saprospiraceae bacterium]|nr:hypothetical protein [Saprospiraceae bacterium]